jgi:ribose-phosphate pyrophosphokinase
MSIEFWGRAPSGHLVRTNFKPFQFPGGEWHITKEDIIEYIEYFAVVRGASTDDLMVAAMWADLLMATTHARRHLFLPYLPAARADRGEPAGVQIYRNMVENIAAHSIVYIDPHSDVSDDLYRGDRGSYLNISPLVGYPIPVERVTVRAVGGSEPGSRYAGVIAPDKGAHRRAQRVGDKLGVPTYFAGKERDFDSGKLLKFTAPAQWTHQEYAGNGDVVEVEYPPTEGRYLVVDDICDGGGTFMGLAGVLGIPRENLDLWVTHGIFSGNAGQLTEAYGNIFTTDSHPGAYNEAVGAKVTKLLPYFYEELSIKEAK